MTTPSTLEERLFCRVQRLLPTHALSRVVHRLARVRQPWLKDRVIERFCRHYEVDLTEAVRGRVRDYETFNDFFTRALRPEARPLPQDPNALCCPVDGTVSQIGAVDGGDIIQAKGQRYTAAQLLASDADAAAFRDGAFATLYLAPSNYHRVHMPLAGRLARTRLVPGRLFSVNPASARGIPGLFARNERLVCLFDTDLGPMALVLVGAMLVGSIETVWGGEASPPRARRVVETAHDGQGLTLARGAEMGRFNMGSSVVMLLPAGAIDWAAPCTAGSPVRMGQVLATRAGS